MAQAKLHFKSAHRSSRARRTEKAHSVQTAELMGEVGFKCIGFNWIPRTINMLGAFRSSLPAEIVSSLNTKPARIPSTANISVIIVRGKALWKSIYRPFDSKLESKLAESHPEFPVHILYHEYGALFADPESGVPVGANVGRVLTSIVAVACLRAQGGVGPQVISHVFGLRKAFEDGSAEAEGEVSEGDRWLASDEGGQWLLGSADGIVDAIGEGNGSGFATGLDKIKSKL
ncbi:mitochondrial protein [Rhexocercosporidium sp. MPI-PUGE-AT-0058]|nr:mitochondrial protein [Rhexocercosporidium sp. MPI-PUGE-AT-0058]